MKAILLFFVFLTGTALQAESVALFNSNDLTGWKIAPMDRGGIVSMVSNHTVSCGVGDPMTGIAYTNPIPITNYELSLEAMRVEGSDFFVALTIPVETNFCTIIIGGWGGGLCGISSVDYTDASENQWSEYITLRNQRWYTLRVRVTPGVLQVFLNEDLYTARIEFETSTRFSLRSGSDIEMTKPLGLATYKTCALWRNFTLTPITTPHASDKVLGDL